MKHFFLLSVAMLVAFACTEIVLEPADTVVGRGTQMSELGADAAAMAPDGSVSTTCRSYRSELEVVSNQLTAETRTDGLEQKHTALSAIVADVCH